MQPIDAATVAAASMLDDMFRVTTISQNLANVTTVGYRRQIAFSEQIQALLPAGNGAVPVTLPTSQVVVDPRNGALRNTGSPLDVAIEGDGFFQLQDDGSAPVYTRDGAFRMDARGRLVNGNGLPVQGTGGDIQLTRPDPRIDAQGRVFEDDKQVAQLSIARFPRAAMLQSAGSGAYASNTPQSATGAPIRVRQGYLEASNAQPLTEMVGLIDAMRHFEMNQKVIQTADEMQDRAIRTLGEF